MDARADLLAAVAAAPDDDAPRLVLSDWLQERGDPWGELIPIDCRLSSLPRFHPDRRVLARRREELLAASYDAWAQPLGPGCRARFRRGFLERVQVTDAGSPAEVLAASMIICRELIVGGIAPQVFPAGFVERAGASVESLTLADTGVPEVAESVLRWLERPGALPRLRRLHVAAWRFPIWPRLLASEVWPRLETLSIANPEAVPDIAAALPRARVTRLTVRGLVQADELRALLGAAPGLVELEVDTDYGAPRGLIPVLADAELPALERLLVRSADHDPDKQGLQKILEAAGLPALRQVSFYSLSGRPVRAPRSLPPRLEQLTWFGAEGADAVLAAILDLAPPALTTLGLGHLSLGGVIAFARSSLPAQLVELDLSRNAIFLDAPKALAAAAWPRLRRLDLSRCSLAGDACDMLVSALPERCLVDLRHNLGPVANARDGVILADVPEPADRRLGFVDDGERDLAGITGRRR